MEAGVEAGISILVDIFGFPFFVFDRPDPVIELRPFLSNVVITSAKELSGVVISFDSILPGK